MKNIIKILFISIFYIGILSPYAEAQANLTGEQIIEKVDDNMSAKNRVVESAMIIHGKRRDRTITSKSWSVGTKQSFSEYLSPAREAGTKMLKTESQLWIYTPQTDRIIQISGHMLRQSVMGSDLSYEDMMDDRTLLDVYKPTQTGIEKLDDRDCYVIDLLAIVEDVAYHKQKMWVDAERFVPLQQELYAKSGQLLKKMTLTDVQKIEGRWFPMTVTYKDMLKDGKGTEYQIKKVAFDQNIPDYIFTKAALKK